MKNKIYILLLFLGLISSCKEESEPCETCVCFNFVEPLRISYQDENGLDLLKQDGFTIDSIKARVLLEDGTRSQDLLHLKFDQRNWVGEPSYNFQYDFLDIENGLVGISVGEPRYPGIGEDQEFLIYLNSNEIDTFNVRWDMWTGPIGDCCLCTGFPNTYFKYNQIQVTENGTETGAIIIRR